MFFYLMARCARRNFWSNKAPRLEGDEIDKHLLPVRKLRRLWSEQDKSQVFVQVNEALIVSSIHFSAREFFGKILQGHWETSPKPGAKRKRSLDRRCSGHERQCV